jgi:hypothetical protein
MVVFGIIMFVFSVILFLISIRHFRKKGFLFNNAYIYATKEERERTDYAPYYRQSAIVFLLIAVQFLMIGFYAVTKWTPFLVAEFIVIVLMLCYAIISSRRIGRKLP